MKRTRKLSHKKVGTNMDTEKETAQIREVKRILNNSKSGSAKEPDIKISNLCPSKEFVDGLLERCGDILGIEYHAR